jgi:hypothetical protein
MIAHPSPFNTTETIFNCYGINVGSSTVSSARGREPFSFLAAFMPSFAILEYSTEISIPIQLRQRSSAATAVVPDPMNGSRTSSAPVNSMHSLANSAPRRRFRLWRCSAGGQRTCSDNVAEVPWMISPYFLRRWVFLLRPLLFDLGVRFVRADFSSRLRFGGLFCGPDLSPS